MMEKIKEKILSKSSSHSFYKNSYDKLVEINKKNTLLLRNNNIQLKQKNQEIINLRKLNEKITLLESQNNTLNARIIQYENILDKISNLESQNKQLKDKITQLNKQNEELSYDNKTKMEKIQYLQKLVKNDKTIDNYDNKTEFLLKNNKSPLETFQFKNQKYYMSIVIPVYNTQNYIEKCFKSILNQSIFNKIEIIFVDDCSKDKSVDKIRQLMEKYDNVKIFSTDKNSLFAGRPRNLGIEHVTSDYMMFLDSDDILLENSCESLLNSIIKHDADMAFGSFLITRISNQDNEKYKIEQKLIPELTKYYEASEELIIEDIRDYPYILGCHLIPSKIFRVKFIKENKIKFPEYIPAEDSYFLYKSMLYSKKTVFIPKNIYKYNYTRNESDNQSVSFRSNHTTRMGRLNSYMMMYQISKQKNVEDITLRHLLYYKVIYLFELNIFNQEMPYDEYIELFDVGYPLFEAILNKGIVSEYYEKLFKMIVNKDYDDAIKLCKTFN